MGHNNPGTGSCLHSWECLRGQSCWHLSQGDPFLTGFRVNSTGFYESTGVSCCCRCSRCCSRQCGCSHWLYCIQHFLWGMVVLEDTWRTPWNVGSGSSGCVVEWSSKTPSMPHSRGRWSCVGSPGMYSLIFPPQSVSLLALLQYLPSILICPQGTCFSALMALCSSVLPQYFPRSPLCPHWLIDGTSPLLFLHVLSIHCNSSPSWAVHTAQHLPQTHQ